MPKRRRFKQTISLRDRLAAFAKKARDKTSDLPPGPEREEMLKKPRQTDTASHLTDWANSPDLRPPT